MASNKCQCRLLPSDEVNCRHNPRHCPKQPTDHYEAPGVRLLLCSGCLTNYNKRWRPTTASHNQKGVTA